jgi:hypothetical protein
MLVEEEVNQQHDIFILVFLVHEYIPTFRQKLMDLSSTEVIQFYCKSLIELAFKVWII